MFWRLAVGVVLIVLIFKSSEALAAAYGIAVTGVMVISTALVAVVARYRWNWKRSSITRARGFVLFYLGDAISSRPLLAAPRTVSAVA